MKSQGRLIVFLAVLLGTALPVRAAGEGGDPDAVGHSADGYYLDFNPVGILELPRLLLVRRSDGGVGFDAFSTTRSALGSGRYGLLTGEGTPMPEAELEEVKAAHDEHLYLYYPLVPEGGQVIVDFSITRQLVFVFISAFLLLGIALRLAGRYRQGFGRKTAPKGTWQNLMEVLIVFVRDDIAHPALGHHSSRFLPYLLTAFLFILIANLFGLVPWGVTATSGIAITGALATFTFIITQWAGTKDYWRHIFNPPGMPLVVKIILVPIEIIGMFTKPLALAFRLFGNMVSGHLVIVSLLGLIFIFSAQFGTGVGWGSVLLSVPLTVFIFLLKLAVAAIQAYVFTILSAVFIGLAIEEHGHHETEDQGHSKIKHHDSTGPLLAEHDHVAHNGATRSAMTQPVSAAG